MIKDKARNRLGRLTTVTRDKLSTNQIEKVGEMLTPNMRALRLALTASDVLLSMGVSANSVVSRALDITDTYCERPAHFSITHDLITVSQIRGIEYEPLTLMRPVTIRATNNMTVQAVQKLIYEIRTGRHTLIEAEAALDRILSHPKAYPGWIPPLANAFIAPAVSLMFTTNWRAILLTYFIAIAVDRLLVMLADRSIVPFFRQIAASGLVTLTAAVIAWFASRHIPFFTGMNPTLTVVSGIFMLLAGLAIVGAIQDAIEEFYLTATARFIRVLMSTGGIVVGVIIGLYVAKSFHIGITVSTNPLQLTALHFQIIGGGLAAAAYALATQTRLRAIVWAGLIGGSTLAIMYISRHAGLAVIAATGVAATTAGLIAALFSRIWRTPSSGIVAAAIVPLVPGLGLYTGLMQLVNYPPGNPLFLTGVATIFTVAGTALAIAAGASFGSMLGRPLYRHVTQNRNLMPFANFMRQQIKADEKEAQR